MYIVQALECTPFWLIVKRNSMRRYKKRKWWFSFLYFLAQSGSLWKKSLLLSIALVTTCVADARKYSSKIICKQQRAQHIPKCSTRVLAFMSPCCKHEQQCCQYGIFLDTEKSTNNNISAMDIATCTQKHRFVFCSAQILFCNQTMFGNKHSLFCDVWLLSNNST